MKMLNKKNVTLEEAIQGTFEKLMAMDNTELQKLYLKHKNGDISKLLQHANAFNAEIMEVEAFWGLQDESSCQDNVDERANKEDTQKR